MLQDDGWWVCRLNYLVDQGAQMRCFALKFPKYISFVCYAEMACSFDYYSLASVTTASKASVLVLRLSAQD
jgi:hypothetical protein